MDELLENAIVYLIRNDRFYAEMVHRMKKKFTTDIDTLGVWVDMDGIHLKINPYLFKQMSVPEQAECLKHECEHPMRNLIHGSDREKSMCPDLYKDKKTLIEKAKEMSLHYLLNIAEDTAINETLPNLPRKLKYYNKDGTPRIDPETGLQQVGSIITVESLREMFPDDTIENNQATEYYFSFIKQKRDEGKFKGADAEGIMYVTLDDHNVLDEALKQIDPQFAKAVVNKIIQDAKEATPGRIPGHMELAIEQLNKKVKDWRQDLQIFNAMCQNSEEECTFRRRNRRYGLLYPGKRVKVRAHLVTIIDSSASVNDKQLTQLASELVGIHACDVDITVIECDTKVNQIYKFDPNVPFKVKGRGGTAFRPAFEAVQNPGFIKDYGEVDGVIYLTDGGNYDHPDIEEPPFNVLWALLPGCDVSYDWGYKTWVEVS